MIQSNDSLFKSLKLANRVQCTKDTNHSLQYDLISYLLKQIRLSVFIFTPYHTESTDSVASGPITSRPTVLWAFLIFSVLGSTGRQNQTPQNPSGAYCAARSIFSWQTLSETYPEVCWRCLELTAWLTQFPITLSNKIISSRKSRALSLRNNDSTICQQSSIMSAWNIHLHEILCRSNTTDTKRKWDSRRNKVQTNTLMIYKYWSY